MSIFHGQWHVSWTVSDIEQSIVFYRDVLEMELTHRQEQDNDYTRRLVGFPDAHLRVAMFRLPAWDSGPSGHLLELVEYLRPAGSRLDLRTCNVGAAHLALWTPDIHSSFKLLKSRGVVFRSDTPVAIEAGANTGGFTCYFSDPDGFTLEMFQPPPHRQMPASHS